MTESNINKRTLGREYAFKFLYKNLMPEFKNDKEKLITDQNFLSKSLAEFDISFSELDDEHPNNILDQNSKTFAQSLIIGALKEETQSLESIQLFSTNKNVEKVDKMNIAVLLLGIFEIKSNSSTSSAVFINEYVNIAKKYCPTDSAGFINSVLDRVSKSNGK